VKRAMAAAAQSKYGASERRGCCCVSAVFGVDFAFHECRWLYRP
jgi:hypothetical protein